MATKTVKDDLSAQLVEEMEYHKFYEFKFKEAQEEIEKLRLENKILRDIWVQLTNILEIPKKEHDSQRATCSE